MGGLLFFGVAEWNLRSGDVLGIGLVHQSSLASENRALREQLSILTKRLRALDDRLASLADRSNEMRLMVDLPKLDEDVRKVGTGGAEELIDFGVSSNVNQLLNSARALAEKAEREIRLQSTNYAEVSSTYEKNKTRFAHFPALKPMDGYYSHRGIGLRLHPVLGIFRNHEGLDIVNDVGTPVYAVADGVISFAGRESGYGIYIQIDHGYSFKTIYGHLSRILVKEGQAVKRGELIARSGNTGLSSGPHLHYEVRHNGVPTNPDQYFFDDLNPSDYRELAQGSQSTSER
ncbi:MAG: peptidoglycan DD-metalloendopeptidase family protein [Ignavibacteriales bacterium]|nr:peptidoglycan DD-metalloendopeptidase family protein [Ignavibacteriales bacterium]